MKIYAILILVMIKIGSMIIVIVIVIDDLHPLCHLQLPALGVDSHCRYPHGTVVVITTRYNRKKV